MVTQTKYNPIWNLDSIFKGGSTSPGLHDHMKQTEAKIMKLEETMKKWTTPLSGSDQLAGFLDQLREIKQSISQARSYAICLLSENPKDQGAQFYRGETTVHQSKYDSIISDLKRKLAHAEEPIWKRLLDSEDLKEYRFILGEWREEADREPVKEVSGLMADGYHAWGQFYQSYMSSIKVRVNGQDFSVGQAINLRSHHDASVRKESHEALVEKWTEHEGQFAQILNHLAGFRLNMYRSVGIEDVLQVPLAQNRMKEETLNSMFSVMERYKKPFTDYLNVKARMNGDAKMKSYHFWSPMNHHHQGIEYGEAAALIEEQFRMFGPEMGRFAEQAFREGWVEAENRPGKSAVPICAGFPLTGESRVFLTFPGTFKGVLTLVHELGHAFHNHAMKSVNGMNKAYPMSLAETASTFAEMIILEAAMEKAESDEEKLFILDEKLKRSVMNFMNLHARFIFEKDFHEERKKGFVPAARLNELMETAMEKGCAGSLDEIPVHSWVWTPHFYKTESPFYNFPYTFGYLLALNLFARAKETGKGFEEQYMHLLRDSGSMSAEELVIKHLGEDITEEAFWEKGMRLCVEDSEEFVRLASSQ
ncbi:M3 family oligoendopeptidase [Rossellomorea yichunensis]|jgi:oligoendopeptidase F|uniref:M3 family oligoendopeptidase n=1 Tax=Rossellomorea yichunensis TaxID=3077331 RepID=UPI0028DE59F3|nr:M3 family oligoendopeptidase [Rossellomorea sp. YC4-1]MDT9025820.1 M3 family oligoendopeptidase [Rossellomorea sp. YC4-1]